MTAADASTERSVERLERLLVCVDFSEVTPAVIGHALAVAAPVGAEVRLLHVAAPDPDFVGYAVGPDTVRQNVARELRDEHRAVERMAEPFRRSNVAVTPLMVRGPTVETILEQAQRFGASLIVLGSHGHGRLFHLLMGSVAEGVTRKSPVAVLLVPADRGNRA